MRFYSTIFLSLLLVAVGFSSHAQNAVSEFVVEYKVTGNNPSVNKTEGDYLSYGFKGSKMHMSLINKMVDLKMVYDNEAGAGLLLNSMKMGSINMAVELKAENLAYEKEEIVLTSNKI